MFNTDVSHVSFSLLANPMEELSPCEAACLAAALPVKEETAKPSPVPTEQLCYYSLHDQRSSVTVACGTVAFRLVKGSCSKVAMVLIHQG